MSPQRRASHHDESHTHSYEHSLKSQILLKRIPLSLSVFLQEEQVGRRSPEDGSGPVADESEEADGDEVEAADAVVSAGKINGGDSVGAAEGEEGRVLEEDGGGSYFCDREIGGLKEVEDNVGEEEEGNVSCPGLGHS